MHKVPTDFRRVTMLVSDIEAALAIYRDILGMVDYYDQEITVSGGGLPTGQPDSRARLVILKCNDPYIGMIGLLQYLDPPLPPREARTVSDRLQAGDLVLVLNHENVEAAFEKLREIEGVRVAAAPHVTEFPKPGGGVFRVMGISFFDPNGYFVDVNQIVE